MKFRRSERLIDMTHFLLQHPCQIVPLTLFADRYEAAKSSVSEDVAIIKETFEQRGFGTLKTVAGAAGGVQYFPAISEEERDSFIQLLCGQLSQPDRLLPGGYLYMADIVGNPEIVKVVGKLFAAKFVNEKVDVVMTVATKGIPLAYATASELNVPVVIVRRDSKVTEGPTVSINYVSGSTKRIQTMALSKRSLQEGSNVLIVDDFMKAGGTINGMMSLLDEFKARVAGIGVLVEAEHSEERLVDHYHSIVKLSKVDIKERKIEVTKGTL
ncbi:pur operon repressor [Bacillus oleivorans]|uniref:pur operon repressor n=1 Tax=Bacillus oleivorans TaxID=1448271 RepID=UPI000BE3AA36|nr:pur operon repressor [Bacillus oleivorans]